MSDLSSPTPVLASATPQVTWGEALREFLLHKEAAFAKKTVRYYKVQLGGLVAWAEHNDVPFAGFGKRHLDRYLIERAKTVSPTTLRHDAVSAKSFFRWRQKNDLPRIRRCASTRPSSACSTATATARSFWDSPTAPAGSARCSMGALGAAGPGEARRRYRHTQRHAAAKRG